MFSPVHVEPWEREFRSLACIVIMKPATRSVHGPFALTGHMVKKSTILDGKKAWQPPLGHQEQRKVNLNWLGFLCVRI